ncbi:uncharacterized protein LOC125777606 [Bactrocera dorsalis]|uniref:Uncharacterized protein LOC125777606 n=1 Tax=Bactrocera dorsalis TaxID=27457 RepID=A0ABM3JHF3_BACDO|nr:uncharacterized protein LOC125777606 [Bactrocera dorsalis]
MRGDGKAVTYAQTVKRKSGQLTPQEPAVKGIRMAVLPQNYPAESLESEQLTVLQNLLMEEVFRDDEYAASFLGVEFKGGMLQVDYMDESFADWLREFTPRLGGWTGPVLCAKRAEDLPVMHRMTVFLPPSDDKPYAVRPTGRERYVRAESFRCFTGSTWWSRGRTNPLPQGARRTSGSGSKQETTVANKVVERMQVYDLAKQPGVSRAEQTALVATADVPDAQEVELPSTQELLEGLGDHVDHSANDGGDVDMPPLEPLP